MQQTNQTKLPAALASVMIEKFAGVCDMAPSEFLKPNQTSKAMIPASLMMPKFARGDSGEVRRTSALRLSTFRFWRLQIAAE
jgi:hypothetical protein